MSQRMNTIAKLLAAFAAVALVWVAIASTFGDEVESVPVPIEYGDELGIRYKSGRMHEANSTEKNAAARRPSVPGGPEVQPDAWKETDYSRALADRLDGTPGHRCADGTVVDVLTAELAIEVEYPEKWAESIGQALHYADQTGRKPAVAYLLRHADSDWRGLVRGSRLCGQLGIRVMVFPADDLRRATVLGDPPGPPPPPEAVGYDAAQAADLPLSPPPAIAGASSIYGPRFQGYLYRHVPRVTYQGVNINEAIDAAAQYRAAEAVAQQLAQQERAEAAKANPRQEFGRRAGQILADLYTLHGIAGGEYEREQIREAIDAIECVPRERPARRPQTEQPGEGAAGRDE